MNLYRPFVSLLAAAGALGLIVSCGGGEADDAESSAPEIEVSAEDMAAAEELFNTQCATCHGTSGKGDGRGASALPIKPRDYTDKAWQASISDDLIRKTILEGGKAVGKSEVMISYKGQIGDKPGVVDGLVKLIRSYGE